MPAVSRFMFYDDPVAKTGGSEVTIDWVNQTFTLPGPSTYPFAVADEVADTIDGAADQVLTDFVADTEHAVYHPTTGALLLTVIAAITPGTPPVVASIRPGGVLAYGPPKARDLADGLRAYIVNA